MHGVPSTAFLAKAADADFLMTILADNVSKSIRGHLVEINLMILLMLSTICVSAINEALMPDMIPNTLLPCSVCFKGICPSLEIDFSSSWQRFRSCLALNSNLSSGVSKISCAMAFLFLHFKPLGCQILRFSCWEKDCDRRSWLRLADGEIPFPLNQ